MSVFSDLISPPTLEEIKNVVKGYAVGAGLTITNWIQGAVGEQVFEGVSRALFEIAAQRIPQVVRGFLIDYATDPGDDDPYDPTNVTLPPARGFLSQCGENFYGTIRQGATFARGEVTFTNAGATSRTISPESLVFKRATALSDGTYPTYTNTADASVYTDPGGTVTVPAGSSVVLPISAQQIGAASNAAAGTLSLVTVLLGCTATNASTVLGADREDAAIYRARCKQAPSRLSFGGPEDAFAYFAAKSADGTPLTNSLGANVAITRVQVVGGSTTGIVSAYYASASGPASAEDVIAANANIETNVYVIPDAITYLGQAATTTTVAAAGTARIKAAPGVTADAIAALCSAAAIMYAAEVPIGGLDQTAGSGYVYAQDLAAYVRANVPGLYAVSALLYGGSSFAVLSVGHVLAVTSSAGAWTVTVVP